MINYFRDEYDWLSNFYSVDIELPTGLYKSVETAYMSMKSSDVEWHEFCQKNSPALVKKKSREIELRDGWDDMKISAMRLCLRLKFNQEPLQSKLKNTLNENIVEGNYWNDTFWGVDLKVNPNVGENHLGRLIMEIRKNI